MDLTGVSSLAGVAARVPSNASFDGSKGGERTDDAAHIAPAVAGKNEKQQAMEAAQDFEAIFIRMLFREMHAATLKGGLFGDNLASEIYQDMFFDEAASRSSKQKPGLGLADAVYRDILKLEGISPNTLGLDDAPEIDVLNLAYSSAVPGAVNPRQAD